MNQPKKQHWVPRFYLKHFATPESLAREKPQVWIISKNKEDGNEVLTNIENICSKTHLYTPLEETGVRNWELEDKLQKFESVGSQWWDILANNFIDLGDKSFRKGIALFIAIMHLRNPNILEESTTLHANMVSVFKEILAEAGDDPIEVLLGDKTLPLDKSGWDEYQSWGEIEHQNFFIDQIKTQAVPLATLLLEKRWSVVFAETPQFATSDCPVTTAHQRKKVFGFGTHGTIVSIPISQYKVLTIDDMLDEPDNQYYPAKDGFVESANFLTWRGARRFLISGRPIKNILTEMVKFTDSLESDGFS
ncbi:MAG: DUF4238 domain-containing protein [Candidatus Omnitrophica bacterium]|nr:DUF4238 domain-containing protein [Candidatus Omnitrophota bacterium]